MSKTAVYSLRIGDLHHHSTELRKRLETLPSHLYSVPCSDTAYISFGGSITNVLSKRNDIMKLCPIEEKLAINSLYPGMHFRTEAREKLHQNLSVIATKRDVHIILDYKTSFVRLIGIVENVKNARTDILLYIDSLMGLVSDSLTLPLYMINIVGNRRHSHFLSIMEETGTNIYLPTVWTSSPMGLEKEGVVHISGDNFEAIKKTQLYLKKLIAQKIRGMCNLHSVLNPRKKDWLLMYKKDELTKIMRDNGSFVLFPTFGSGNNRVEVYAENNVNADRTLRTLNYLASHIFEAAVCVNTTQSADAVARISQESGVEVIYKADEKMYEIMGSREEIQAAIQAIRMLSICQEHHHFTSFTIELALDQQEFISGKKNGKINKIMKSCDAKIQFQSFNDYNFIITIESRDFFKTIDGLESLQDELPAEISFFVPEMCHRRIIGVAGKNIQRVMKQYGVYVKFSSNDELATFGGYFENEHNVVARTPKKNIESLDKLKSAVMEFVAFQKDRDYVSREFKIPFYAQRKMLSLNGKYLRDKGRLYNARIIWPDRNGSDSIWIMGPKSHLDEMQLRIQRLLPQSLQIQVPASVTLENILASTKIEELADRIFRDTHIYLVFPDTLSNNTSDPPASYPGIKIQHDTIIPLYDTRVMIFKLMYDANTKSQLLNAKKMFENFMTERFVPLDDTLHHFKLNGSPSPEDIRHISPSIMHHIDHPESYEGHTNRNSKLTDSTQQSDKGNLFNQKKIQESESNLLLKSTLNLRSPDHYTSNYSPLSPTQTQYNNNAWIDKPYEYQNHNSKFELRENQGFYAPLPRMSESSSYDRTRPDLKPQYSLSSTTKQPSSLLQNSMNSNVFYTSEPLARPPTHMSNQYLSTPFSPTNNGYIRQRSTSLLPINSYTQNTADLDTGMKNLSFEHLYMPPPPRMGMGYSVSNDGFNSPFYPPERNSPSGSLSTPVPIRTRNVRNSHTQFSNAQ